MFSRTSDPRLLIAPLALLASCGEEPPEPPADTGWPRVVACGPDGGDRVLDCPLEVADADGGYRMTVRQPEGGFHRIDTDGARWTAADGAAPLEVVGLAAGGIDVRIGGWQYRMPVREGAR